MPLKFRAKLDKILELLLYLAHKRPGADKYQAVKFFYLADREHFRRYGRPITFEDYYALWYGPVASNALNFLEQDKIVWKRAGIKELPFKTEIGKAKNGKDTTYIREPLRDVDMDLFSKTDLAVFDEILEQHGDDDFNTLMKLTHEHFAYTNAWRTRKQGERAEMFYEEMVDDVERRKALIEDLSPVAAKM